jgi:hypothetical protein
MKKTRLIISSALLLTCASVFAAPPANEFNGKPVVHQNNKKPHDNKVQPKSHHNKKPLRKPDKKASEKRVKAFHHARND